MNIIRDGQHPNDFWLPVEIVLMVVVGIVQGGFMHNKACRPEWLIGEEVELTVVSKNSRAMAVTASLVFWLQGAVPNETSHRANRDSF